MSESFSNYFNYFTEIEEHFQRARGTSLFLLSPLDWALIESWKNSGVPLEAVLRGIDLAFEKWRARRSRVQLVNSLAFCSQAVMTEAQRMADARQASPARQGTPPRKSAPFPNDDLVGFIEANAARIRAAGVPEFTAVADSLNRIGLELPSLSADLESLEQRLTVLEQKLVAVARTLEMQFLERSTLESAGLPRLSLFYLR